MMVNEFKIRELLSSTALNQNSCEEPKIDDDLRNFGLNSITSIELIVKIEDEFNITILDEDLIIDNVCTIDNIIQFINKYEN